MGIDLWKNPPYTIILQEQMRDSVEFLCVLQEWAEQGGEKAGKTEKMFKE